MKCLLVRCSSIERGHQKEVKFGTPSLQTSMLRNTQNLRSSRGHVETAGLCCVGNTRKKWNEIKASGIDAEVNEIDTIIEELIRKENAAVSTGGVDKKKVEEEKKAAKKIEKRPWNVWEKVAKDVGQMERWKWRRKRERAVAKLWSFSEKKDS